MIVLGEQQTSVGAAAVLAATEYAKRPCAEWPTMRAELLRLRDAVQRRELGSMAALDMQDEDLALIAAAVVLVTEPPA